MPTALVTGASSGIGRELTRVLAGDGWDCVITARRYERLVELQHELESQHPSLVLPVQADLADAATPGRLLGEVAKHGLTVDFLVNNAGFGLFGPFTPQSWERVRDMLAVNVTALTHLTKLTLPGMLARRQGRILNVASTAAYVPGPSHAVYHATKAYVLSSSEALWQETRGTGVTVTALCPGPTLTEFQRVAGISEGGGGFMGAARVARIGYRAALRGQRVAIAGGTNGLTTIAMRYLPHGLLLWAVARYNRSS